ncbi:MAG: EAL domain-containing protein [Beijerinckiaceae bacterium]|jgi:diguanylate cyclase (GGDEF)-like protein/PAS domain S-box-containing protein|nr:EAL domain-containing protein [Beijerinckiaceae bacterium]
MRPTPLDDTSAACAADAPAEALSSVSKDGAGVPSAKAAAGQGPGTGLLAAAVDALPHSIFIIGPDGRYIFQNAHDRALFGALLDQSAQDCSDEVSDVWRSAHARALAGEDVRYVDVLQQDGETRSVETFIRPLAIGAGGNGAVGISIDQTGLIATRAELDQERARLQDFLDSSSDWIWEQDESFVFTHWHMPQQSVMRAPIGFTRWGFAGADVERDPVWKAHKESLERHEAITNFVYQTADRVGGDMWIEVSGRPVFDGAGRFRGYRGTARDVTRREELTQQLRDALAHARSVLSELGAYKAALDEHSIVNVVDPSGTLLFVNDLFCQTTGYARQEALGRDVGDLLDSDKHPPAFFRSIRETLSAGHTWRSRICNRTKSGSYYWLDETVVPQRNDDGEIIAFVSIAFDITEAVEAEQKTRDSEARFRLLADNSSDVIILGHNDGRRSYFSPAVLKLTGYTPDEALAVPMREWVHPEDLGPLYKATSQLSAATPQTLIVHRLKRKDGSYIWVEGAFSLVDVPGAEPHIVANIRDVTERTSLEADYRKLFDHSIVGIYRKTLDGHLVRANPALVAMRGYASEQALLDANNAGNANWRVDPRRQQERHELLLRDGLITDFVSEVRTLRSEQTIWISETAWLVRDDNGEPIYVEGMVADVTERVTSQAALERQARSDALTGLPNRRAFCEIVQMRLSQDSAGTHSVIYVDLDRFKAVNDSHGHAAGDEVVCEVAARLRRIIGEEDVLARIGGDEFIILAAEGRAGTRCEQLAVQIIASVNHPIMLASGQIANVGASIGVAAPEAAETSAEAVIRRADLAMYQAKRDGRNAYRRYSLVLDEQVRLRQTIDIGLRSAVDNREFELHFQPVYQAKGLVHSGFEALIRWRHPEHGLMSPADFIPIAEETGMIVPIGAWVLDEALRQAATWPVACRIAINASVVQLRHPDFAALVSGALTRHRIAPERLEIEVTESVLLDDNQTALTVLHKLQGAGVTVALDDFGTGWSSLSYLNRHRFDRIKIDRSFVRGIADRRNDAIIRAIVDMGTRLGIQITAEGVETQSQLEALTGLGCHELQGYLLGRPVPAEDAMMLAAAQLSRLRRGGVVRAIR